MLKALTKTVIETALEEEMSEHLGYEKHDVAGRNSGNSRYGVRYQDGADRRYRWPPQRLFRRT